MSDKNAVRSDETTLSHRQETSNVELKARRRARGYKAACFFFAWGQAGILHKYAVLHSREAYQARWQELMAPINARISEWIMLWLAPLSLKARTGGPPWMDSTAMFVIAHLTCLFYARFYYNWNRHSDRFQLPIVVVAAIVGLVAALSLNLGALISVCVVTPKAALCGLLLSDIIHLVLYGPWRKEKENEKAGDVEDGMQDAQQDRQPRDEEKMPVVQTDRSEPMETH